MREEYYSFNMINKPFVIIHDAHPNTMNARKVRLVWMFSIYVVLKDVSVMLPVTSEMHKMLKMKRMCIDAY
jgi:hypothetical protein